MIRVALLALLLVPQDRPAWQDRLERASSSPQAWKARRDEIFDEIEKLSNKTRGAGAIRVMGVTP
jgi:hypothetical protein